MPLNWGKPKDHSVCLLFFAHTMLRHHRLVFVHFVGYGTHLEILKEIPRSMQPIQPVYNSESINVNLASPLRSPTAPCYLLEGVSPLHGHLQLSAAKNAVTKMVIATLLTEELCILRNVPLLGDLYLTIALCRDMGAQVQLHDHTLSICTPGINSTTVSTEVG